MGMQFFFVRNTSTITGYQQNCTTNDPKMGHFQDAFTKGPAIKKFMPLVVISEAHDALYKNILVLN